MMDSLAYLMTLLTAPKRKPRPPTIKELEQRRAAAEIAAWNAAVDAKKRARKGKS